MTQGVIGWMDVDKSRGCRKTRKLEGFLKWSARWRESLCFPFGVPESERSGLECFVQMFKMEQYLGKACENVRCKDHHKESSTQLKGDSHGTDPADYCFGALVWRRRRLLRISEMGDGRRRRDCRVGPDHPVGFVPVRRNAYVT